MAIDPLISLAFAMHSNKGVYALLLGSGISRSAGIPTGWEIILDLIRKVARLRGDDPKPDPEAWYRREFEEEPSYSSLVGYVAKTPAERQQLLKSYFEPSNEEREGKKQPTEAHHAIAQLVASGYVRVIITTNFDRLLEQSLDAVGVVPTVIRTPGDADGARPICHNTCTVIKLHGDYLDTRIKNTAAELAKYDRRINKILDEVFDQYGLIICGWSADWDGALYDAIRRCKSRRFTTYWAAHGSLGDKALELVDWRRVEVIAKQTADAFFQSLTEKVTALEEFSQPHPMSAPIAVATLKRYLPDPMHRIRLAELVRGETERLVGELCSDRFPTEWGFNPASFKNRVKRYDAAIEVLCNLLIVGCYWGEDSHRRIWVESVFRIVNHWQPVTGVATFPELRRYPALGLLYGIGIACVARGEYSTLAALLLDGRMYGTGSKLPFELWWRLARLNPKGVWRKLYPNALTPVSEHLYGVLREPFKEFLPDQQDFCCAFDRFEYLLALHYADLWDPASCPNLMPVPRFHFEGGSPTSIDREIESNGADWAPLRAGLFGGSTDRLRAAVQKTGEYLQKVPRF